VTAHSNGDGQTSLGRVVEFVLSGERYCIEIDYVEEIVKSKQVTRVPNTPAFVEGVVDLRGQVTTVVNPKVSLEIGDEQPGEYILVFDPDALEESEQLGWAVDGVRQVTPIHESEVTDAPVEDGHIKGIVDRDGEEFIIWTTPELATG